LNIPDARGSLFISRNVWEEKVFSVASASVICVVAASKVLRTCFSLTRPDMVVRSIESLHANCFHLLARISRTFHLDHRKQHRKSIKLCSTDELLGNKTRYERANLHHSGKWQRHENVNLIAKELRLGAFLETWRCTGSLGVKSM
jgi:hypothetical protein